MTKPEHIQRTMDLCRQIDEAAAALIAAIPAAKSKPDNTPPVDRRTK